jgi:ligand-binding sensor domain-containing protein
VSALAHLGSRLVAGLFDGGLAMAEEKESGLVWRTVPGTAAWGVNALLPAGGVLYVASLRGAARFDGATLKPLDGPGAAFSLAATPDGVVIGYGQGMLLPGPRLLSAFHGLPGNQVLALAPDSASGLFAGTPWGLAAVEGGKVRWRVGPGEGALPHPWITALALDQDMLYVGTYGGGVTRRAIARPLEPGRFEPFPETQRLKVSAGCLLVAGGRLYLGTEGSGVLRLSRDRKRFEPVRLALPSPHVTALLAAEGALYVGTDEGLVRFPIDTDSPPTRQMASILETTK